jgi:hypothetical protein
MMGVLPFSEYRFQGWHNGGGGLKIPDPPEMKEYTILDDYDQKVLRK